MTKNIRDRVFRRNYSTVKNYLKLEGVKFEDLILPV